MERRSCACKPSCMLSLLVAWYLGIMLPESTGAQLAALAKWPEQPPAHSSSGTEHSGATQGLLWGDWLVRDYGEGVAHAKFGFEVQGGPISSQAPIHHDGNAVTQNVSLLLQEGHCTWIWAHVPAVKSGHSPSCQGRAATFCRTWHVGGASNVEGQREAVSLVHTPHAPHGGACLHPQAQWPSSRVQQVASSRSPRQAVFPLLLNQPTRPAAGLTAPLFTSICQCEVCTVQHSFKLNGQNDLKLTMLCVVSTIAHWSRCLLMTSHVNLHPRPWTTISWLPCHSDRPQQWLLPCQAAIKLQ